MIARFNRKNHVKNLPDAYCKTPESNNAKLLEIEKSAVEKLRETLDAVYASLDLENAKGKTLDLYGEMVGQERGRATDTQYRILIKSRIARNFANGDYNSIVNLICLIFGCKGSEISFVETEKPCTVRIDALPFGALNNLAIDVNTALQIIRECIPAGVAIESISLTGTFEFSGGTELVYDEAAGFADEAQTIGGYLGAVFEENAPALPV